MFVTQMQSIQLSLVFLSAGKHFIFQKFLFDDDDLCILCIIGKSCPEIWGEVCRLAASDLNIWGISAIDIWYLITSQLSVFAKQISKKFQHKLSYTLDKTSVCNVTLLDPPRFKIFKHSVGVKWGGRTNKLFNLLESLFSFILEYTWNRGARFWP